MKHISKIGMMIVAGGLLAATSCSDFSDYNTVPEANNPAADKTLWENISENKDLSDFATVLKRVGYDKVLSESHTYTVWAPVNGSFNTDSLSRVSDAKVEREFIMNHIADYAHRETDVNDTIVFMLNEKLLKFTSKNTAFLAFDTHKVKPNANNATLFNYPSVNGLLYVISNPTTFRFNGYEYISEMAEKASKFFAYVNKYEASVLDESASVKGEIKDGVQHYDDSVMIVTNSLIEGRQNLNADISNEDSTYTVLIPTDEAWDNSYNTIASYYKYIPKISYQNLEDLSLQGKKGGTKTSFTIKAADAALSTAIAAAPADAEIQVTEEYWTDSITKLLMVNNLIYSETNKRYNSKLTSGAAFVESDTLFATTRSLVTNLPALDAATVETVKLSNGHARILNKFPFSAEETYAPIIRTYEVARVVTATGATYSYESIDKAMLDPAMCQLEEYQTALRYVKTPLPEGTNYAPELDFYLEDVLSTTYDVKLVVVPACVENPALPVEERKPYTLIVDINYTDADNKQITARFAGEGKDLLTTTTQLKKTEPFEVGKDKVDTVMLGRITFPICYAGTDAKPNIKVMHSVNSFLSSYKKKYEQTLRIANVILEPVMPEENTQNANKD